MKKPETVYIISKIGQPYYSIFPSNLEDVPLQDLYRGSDTRHAVIAPGVTIETKIKSDIIGSVFVTRRANLGIETNDDPLPFNLHLLDTQAAVRDSLGMPKESQGPTRLPYPLNDTGGWDAYSLSNDKQQSLEVIFMYNTENLIVTIKFSKEY